MPPFLKCLLRRFGETEINGAREKLLGAVDSTGGQQLLGAQDAQLIALFGPDQILPTLAPRQ